MIININVLGIVQGVGFRPFIARLAESLCINGSVLNCGGFVKILAQGNKEILDEFVSKIKSEAPLGSNILKIEITEANEQKLSGFQILSSKGDMDETPILPPDLPVCDICLKELDDPNNRRYNYPFISCTSCGPRYSIMESVPYDRHTTSMSDFEFCQDCYDEYTNNDRRRHAQTVSCHNCGPQLLLKTLDGATYMRDEAFERAVYLLKNSEVIAIKGIGGYQFACMPSDEIAVSNLRLLKNRDKKPFAVMFSSIDDIKRCCSVSDLEENLLLSSARPIVLLEKETEIFCDNVSGESRFIGAFLPYTPLHKLLIDECGPLVMTSGNLSSEPIIFEDKVMLSHEMFSHKSPYLAGVLYNKRRIVTPLDDSVTRVICQSPQVIRRSRGYAPLPIILDKKAVEPILALGGDLKASFCLMKDDRAYLSQYIGDMDDFGVSTVYNNTLEHMENLFGIYPKILACDLHPRYHTTQLSSIIEKKNNNTRVIKIQHHHAHIASVMAEHSLETCIGVAFDGTGYGTDGSIWGGEFLVCNKASYKRAANLKPVKMCGGDTASKDASLALLCCLYDLGLTSEDERFSIIKAAINNNINTYLSSSAGRLFDIVSAILGIRSYNSYEGECAIALENAADLARRKGNYAYPLQFVIEYVDDGRLEINYAELILSLLDAINNDVDKNSLALGFHIAIAEAVHSVCISLRNSFGENNVALSGGVFANTIFTQECIDRLKRDNFIVYLNKDVPTNDGGICLGQAWLASQM